MATTPTLAAPFLADLIPAHELARAARLAFDTLVSILSDAKATINERRIAAMAVLRLATPKRASTASSACTPPIEPPSPKQTPTPAKTEPPAQAGGLAPPPIQHPPLVRPAPINRAPHPSYAPS